MSTLARFLHRRGERASNVSLEEFAALLAGNPEKTVAGIEVGDRRALGITAWYSGVRYLSETVASLPAKVFLDSRGIRSEQSAAPWLARPDKELTKFGLFEVLMMSLVNRGNAYAFKIRNNLEQVVGLRPLHPDRVRMGQASDRSKVFTVDDVPFTTREVLHIPALSMDGVWGMNPIALHRQALGTIAAADEHAARFFGQGTHVAGVISVPQQLDPPSADRLKVEWKQFHEGIRNHHQVGVLSKGATYQPIGLNAEDSQLIESREYGVAEVSRILRIPPHKLYDLTHATFSNIEHQAIEAVQDSIRPWVVRIESWINFDRDLMYQPGSFLEFSVDGIQRGDFKTRIEGYASGIQAGFMEPNRARSLENWPPIPGGDELLRPLNMSRQGEDDGAAAKVLLDKVNAAGALVRAGYDPAGALAAAGLDPIKHLGLLPVTVQPDE